MTFTIFAASMLALQAADEPVPETAEAPTAQPEPEIEVVENKLPKAEKITDKSDPNYIRCKSEAVIGSRAKRKRTCMTNREWALVQRRGNEASRSFVDDNAAGFMGGNN